MSEQTADHQAIWAAFITFDDAIPDAMLDVTERPMERLREAICATYGHWPFADQCNIPDHDYCLVCGCSMPGAAHVEAVSDPGPTNEGEKP